MEIIKEEESTPQEIVKKKWHKPKLYWGKEIGFFGAQSDGDGPSGTPS